MSFECSKKISCSKYSPMSFVSSQSTLSQPCLKGLIDKLSQVALQILRLPALHQVRVFPAGTPMQNSVFHSLQQTGCIHPSLKHSSSCYPNIAGLKCPRAVSNLQVRLRLNFRYIGLWSHWNLEKLFALCCYSRRIVQFFQNSCD